MLCLWHDLVERWNGERHSLHSHRYFNGNAYETINIILEVMNDSVGSIFSVQTAKMCCYSHLPWVVFWCTAFFTFGWIFFSRKFSILAAVVWFTRKWNMHLTFTWCWRLHNTHLSLGNSFSLDVHGFTNRLAIVHYTEWLTMICRFVFRHSVFGQCLPCLITLFIPLFKHKAHKSMIYF